MAQKQFIIDGGFTTNADSSLTGNLDMTGHIIPSVDSDGITGYDLGSPSMKWRDLYLSQGSLYIDGQKVIESNSGTIVVQADPGQSLTTKVSGAGVMTLESDTTINVAATLQMADGKKVTSASGNAVVFGDKLDMDNNQIINIGSPTADGHVASKSYVDSKFDDVLGGAPAALDTLNELANALGDDANFAASVTNALATKASTAYVDGEISTLSASVAAGAYGDSDVQSVLDSRPSFADGLGIASGKMLFADGDAGNPAQYAWATNNSGQMTLTAWKYARGNGQSHLTLDAGTGGIDVKGARIFDLATPVYPTDAVTKDYVDSNAYGDNDVVSYNANNQTYFKNIRTANTSASVGTWAAPFSQVNGKSIGLTESLIWPSSNAENGSYKIIEIVGQSGTGILHAEFFPDVIKPGYSTGNDNIYLKPNSGGVVNVGLSRISDVRTPLGNEDAANKSYVDQAEADAIASAEAKDVVRAAAAEAYADQAEADAKAYTDTREVVLQGNIDTEKSRIDAIMSASTADADTFAEVVALVNSVDATNDSVLAGEIANRTSADSALSGRLDVVEGSGAGSVAKAEADAIVSAEAKDVVRAAAAEAYADQAEADAIAAAEAKDAVRASAAAADATAKANAAQSAAIAASAAALTSFHSAIQDVTSATDVTHTFPELVGAKFYQVFLNRQLIRPSELASVNLTTGVVTFAANVVSTDDEVEVNGFKA